MIRDHSIPSSIELQSSQLRWLYSTPISLIPSPGAGKAIIIDEVVLFKEAGTAYILAANKDIVLRYGSAGTTLLTIETTGFLDQTSAQSRIYNITNTGFVPTADKDIEAYMTTGNITGGSGSLKFLFKYHVIPTVF